MQSPIGTRSNFPTSIQSKRQENPQKQQTNGRLNISFPKGHQALENPTAMSAECAVVRPQLVTQHPSNKLGTPTNACNLITMWRGLRQEDCYGFLVSNLAETQALQSQEAFLQRNRQNDGGGCPLLSSGVYTHIHRHMSTHTHTDVHK